MTLIEKVMFIFILIYSCITIYILLTQIWIIEQIKAAKLNTKVDYWEWTSAPRHLFCASGGGGAANKGKDAQPPLHYNCDSYIAQPRAKKKKKKAHARRNKKR